jgi:hypothetical protein
VLIGIVLAVGSVPSSAQEHATTPAAKPQNTQVTPTVPATKVAAAVAEALRAAEAAEARRASRGTIRTMLPRSTPAAPTRKYQVRWPEQRMVVQWPGTSDDRVTLIWPDGF